MFFRKILLSLVNKAKNDNDKNILDLLEKDSYAILMDLGCDDGQWTLKLGERIGTKNLFGIDIVDEQIEKAIKRGIKCSRADLNNDLPFEDNFFTVVHANQVIEHTHNLEKFVEEIYRILKPGGYAIISTENLASWHNIFALFFGWQPFSATNYLPQSIGNPLALWRKSEPTDNKSWCHDKLWAYRGLIELFESYNFKVEEVQGAGYYPLPSFFGNIDKRHCHWLTIKARKI